MIPKLSRYNPIKVGLAIISGSVLLGTSAFALSPNACLTPAVSTSGNANWSQVSIRITNKCTAAVNMQSSTITFQSNSNVNTTVWGSFSPLSYPDNSLQVVSVQAAGKIFNSTIALHFPKDSWGGASSLPKGSSFSITYGVAKPNIVSGSVQVNIAGSTPVPSPTPTPTPVPTPTPNPTPVPTPTPNPTPVPTPTPTPTPVPTPTPTPTPVPTPTPTPGPTPTPTPTPVPTPTPTPTPVPTPTPTPTPPPTSGSWGGTHIPFQLNGGLTATQADTILSLVSIAENSTTSWWNNYTYIQDIGDGRGYTINIVGFCTGTGDFLWLVQDLQKINPNHPLVKYLPALQKVNGTASHTGLDGLPALIASLGNDQDYLTATWDAIQHFYWNPAMNTAAQYGLVTPISKGQLYDIALNAGDLSITTRVKATPPSKGGDETTWLKELQSLWLTHITVEDKSLDSGQPDRAKMWQSILSSGNVNLNRPLNNLMCYGDTFQIK